jgi:hypothetical protein
MENISSAEAKLDGIQLSNITCILLKDDLDQAEGETGRLTTLSELAHSLM